MKDHHVPQEHLSAFARRLAEEERSAGTVEKYLRDAGAFLEWLAGAPVSREAVTGWKAHLVRSGYRPATINSMLAALNTFLRFIGLEDCRVRALRVQRRLFQSEERELSRQEYQRLLDTARTLGRDRLALVMETIASASEPGWPPPRSSLTTCAISLRAPSIRPPGTWPSWPMSWGTPALRPPASISSPPVPSTAGIWTACASSARQNQYFASSDQERPQEAT